MGPSAGSTKGQRPVNEGTAARSTTSKAEEHRTLTDAATQGAMRGTGTSSSPSSSQGAGVHARVATDPEAATRLAVGNAFTEVTVAQAIKAGSCDA